MRKLIILVLAAIILVGLTGCHRWHYSSNIGFGVGHGYGYDYEVTRPGVVEVD